MEQFPSEPGKKKMATPPEAVQRARREGDKSKLQTYARNAGKRSAQTRAERLAAKNEALRAAEVREADIKEMFEHFSPEEPNTEEVQRWREAGEDTLPPSLYD